MQLANIEEDEKIARQREILEILGNEPIETQDDLVRAIRKKGFRSTQTTISRDLMELRIAKVGGAYRTLGANSVSSIERAFLEHSKSADSAGENLIVLRTRIGSAATVAIELDGMEWKEIVGTVAGDDTIFIAVPGKKENEIVLRRLRKLIPSGDVE